METRAGTTTQERKRAAKAMPPRVKSWSPGCFVALLVFFGVCALLFWWSRSWFWALLALPAAAAIATVTFREVKSLVLLAECRRVLEPRGVRFLIVYSESPNWAEYIRRTWLPRFGQSAVLLNWTARAQWGSSLEVRLFKHFIKAWRNFNPAVLVLRGCTPPLVVRFYYAFHEAKGGRRAYLDELEKELFEQL